MRPCTRSGTAQAAANWLEFPKWFADFATVLWVFGVAKTVDFIDGLDGLAAGVCAICAATLALMSAQVHQYEVTIIAATLVGVCLGFLRFNSNPATIFMGTVGAQFLGFTLAAISIIGTFKIAATVSVAAARCWCWASRSSTASASSPPAPLPGRPRICRTRPRTSIMSCSKNTAPPAAPSG